MSRRPIRSFVIREGRMTPAQAEALEVLWPKYSLEITQPVVDFAQLFGREAPVVLEIGFGNGRSLWQMAQANPDLNFVGIEVHRPGIGALLIALEQQGITNLRIMQGDAVEILQKIIPDDSLQTIQIFFPDPWPKKRHHKRRLIQVPFIKLLAKKLKTKGQLHLATDWENYAYHMLEVISQVDSFVNQSSENKFVENNQLRPETKFEKRGRRLGHDVWDLLFNKES